MFLVLAALLNAGPLFSQINSPFYDSFAEGSGYQYGSTVDYTGHGLGTGVPFGSYDYSNVGGSNPSYLNNLPAGMGVPFSSFIKGSVRSPSSFNSNTYGLYNYMGQHNTPYSGYSNGYGTSGFYYPIGFQNRAPINVLDSARGYNAKFDMFQDRPSIMRKMRARAVEQ